MKITKKDYQKALKIVKDYKKTINKKHIKSFNCICCNAKIEPLKESGLSEGLISPLNQSDGWWLDGTVSMFYANYGSSFDDSIFYFGICDKCIERLIKEKKIINREDLINNLKKEGLLNENNKID